MGARRFWDPHWSQAATAAVPDGTITLNDYRALDLTRPLTDPPIGHDQTRRLANAAASAAATERDGYDLSNRNPATRQPDVAANERNRKRRQRTSIPGDTPAVRRHTA